jgi:hypothetical protein
VMLAVVVFQGLAADVRREGINGVRERRQGVFHDFPWWVKMGEDG